MKDAELTEGSLVAEVARMEESTGGEAWAFLVDDGYVDAAVYSSNGNGYMGAFPNPVPEDEKMAFSASDETLAIAANVDEDWVTSES